jgi:hypothetical protein
LAGLVILLNFLAGDIRSGFVLKQISRFALLGLLLIIVGFQTFTFTLVFQMLIHRNKGITKSQS